MCCRSGKILLQASKDYERSYGQAFCMHWIRLRSRSFNILDGSQKQSCLVFGSWFQYLRSFNMGLSENRVYSQWNSHLIGIMMSKTIGFRGLAYFQTHPYISFCFLFWSVHERLVLESSTSWSAPLRMVPGVSCFISTHRMSSIELIGVTRGNLPQAMACSHDQTMFFSS